LTDEPGTFEDLGFSTPTPPYFCAAVFTLVFPNLPLLTTGLFFSPVWAPKQFSPLGVLAPFYAPAYFPLGIYPVCGLPHYVSLFHHRECFLLRPVAADTLFLVLLVRRSRHPVRVLTVQSIRLFLKACMKGDVSFLLGDFQILHEGRVSAFPIRGDFHFSPKKLDLPGGLSGQPRMWF